MKPVKTAIAGILLTASVAQFAYSQEGGKVSADDLPVATGQATLTIAGNGYWHREVLSSGDQPVITAVGSEGQILEDGIYRYEYRMVSGTVSSSPRQQDMLRGHGKVSSPGSRKSRGRNTYAGTFEVQAGQVVFR